MKQSLYPPSRLVIEDIVRRALLEDVAHGDPTTEATIAAGSLGEAAVVARHPQIISGLIVLEAVYALLDTAVQVAPRRADGERAEAGAEVARVRGPSASILVGERVALNFMQRMGGVATLTGRYASCLPAGSQTRITDTRKTTPGLRALERYAVRCGGGINHRENLGSAVLIKDNHIAAAGGVADAIARARARAPHTSRIECEVDTLEQLDLALAAGADILLIDNFDDEAAAEAVRRVGGRALVEASGGIRPERVRALAEAGVDVISVGALTHSAPAVDLGLDWR